MPRRIPVALLLLGQLCLAQATTDLFELPLEALMSLPVETPSKLPQSLAGAAGGVSVFSHDEIALFGGRDLGEVLSRINGVEPQQFASLWSPLTVRADPASVNNNHVLILLNGMPFNREGYLGGLFNHIMLTSIPLEAIRQIEVVRGPGSVLYGSNAFAGVINIITRDESSVGNQVSVSRGSFDTELAEASVATGGDGWQLAGFFQYYDMGGWDQVTHTPSGTEFQMEEAVDAPGGLVTGRFGNLRLNAYWGESDYAQLRGTMTAPFRGETRVEKRFLNLGWDQALAADWELKLDAGLMQSRPFIQVNAVAAIDYRFDDSHYEAQLLGQLTPDLQWVSGLVRDEYRGSIDPVIVPEWNYGSWSAYTELQYQWRDTRLIGGVQLNKAENIDLVAVPRLGIIQNFTEHSGLKLLYGQAFRAPAIGETAIDTPLQLGGFFLKGNPDLEHEQVTTTDLQLFHNGPEVQVALTLFQNVQKDLIVRATQGSTITFVNQGELRIRGLELEGKTVLGERWYLLGSATWQENEDGNGVENVSLQPQHMLKAGIAYRALDWSVGLYNIHSGQYPDNQVVVPTRLLVNPEADAYDLLSLNFNYRMRELGDAQLEIYLDNLLDETIYRPTLPGVGLVSNTTSYRDGRYGQIGITLPF